MRTLLVNNNVVVNIIVSTEEHNQNISSQYQHIEVVPDDSPVTIGATWDGENYTNPPTPEE